MKQFALSLIGTLLAASAAQAGVNVQISNLGPADPTAAAGGENVNYNAYLFTLVTTEPGELITAVDFGSTTDLDDGFTGSFLQRLVADPDSGELTQLTPQSTVRNSANASSFDSHFLTPAASRVDVAAPSEDNNGVNPPLAPADTTVSDFGAGTFLRGTFGLTSAARTGSLDVAYLVLPTGGAAVFNGDIATTSSLQAFQVTGTVPVPEPAAASLLLAGGAAALLRRGRRDAAARA